MSIPKISKLVFFIAFNILLSLNCVGEAGKVVIINRYAKWDGIFVSYYKPYSTIPVMTHELMNSNFVDKVNYKIEIPTESPLLFSFSWDFKLQIVYLFPGDTLEFDLDTNENMPYQFSGTRSYDELMFYSKLEDSKLGVLAGNQDIEATSRLNYQYILDQTAERYRERLNLLDSYSASGKISEDGYSLIKHSLYYQYLGELLFPYKAWTSIEQVQTNSKVVPAYYKKHLRDVLTEFDKPDMMASMFYRRFIIQYARFLLVEDSGIENINVASQLSYYRNTYSDFRKEPLLYDEVCLFYQASGDRAPILEVLNAIKNEDMRGTLDSLSRETKVEFSQQALTFLLEKSDGTLTSLAQILNENKGYVLYLDFWASWCRPCLAEMPNADELSKEFSDGSVKFIYFSIDETKDRWLAKLNFLPRGNHVLSYRMLNAEDFLREMKIPAIPKYILIGEKGNMILFNAPRPGTMEIRSLIAENLKQR